MNVPLFRMRLALLLGALLAGCSSAPQQQCADAGPLFARITLHLGSCPRNECGVGVEKALTRCLGIAPDIDMDRGVVVLTISNPRSLDLSLFERALREGGVSLRYAVVQFTEDLIVNPSAQVAEVPQTRQVLPLRDASRWVRVSRLSWQPGAQSFQPLID